MIDMRRRDFISGMAAFAAMPPFVAFAEGTNCAQSASVQIHRNEERQSELLTKWNEATEAVSQKVYGQYLRDGGTRGFKALEVLEHAFEKVVREVKETAV